MQNVEQKLQQKFNIFGESSTKRWPGLVEFHEEPRTRFAPPFEGVA
jgi:hypothetical protein